MTKDSTRPEIDDSTEERRLRDELERRSAELGESEARFRSIVDRIADGIVILGADGRVLFVNAGAERMFGRSAADLVGHDFGIPLVSGETTEMDIVGRGTAEPVVAELRVSGTTWQGVPAQVVSLRDVTDRKEAEERQRQLVREQTARERAEAEEQRFRFLADAGTVLDSSLDFHEVLNRLAKLVVSPNEELHSPTAGRPTHPRLADWCAVDIVEDSGEISRVAAVHHDPKKQGWIEELVRRFPPDWSHPYPATRAIESGEAVLYTDLDATKLREMSRSADHADLLLRLGTESVIAVPLLSRGRVAGALTLACAQHTYHESDLALASDLGHRAALAVVNARLYRAAQEASRAKSEFLAVMSHELRTPLNAIIGYTDLLQAGVSGPLSEKQMENLERIADSSRHLLQIVDEILSYARMESGSEKIRPEPVDLGALAEEVGSMIEPLAERKGLTLHVDEPRDQVVLETDPRKVRQILVNLLSNAVKFTDEGEIRLLLQPDGRHVQFLVSDTGIGIPDEHAEKIFEPFWQVEQSSTRSAGGTGLGLSVARRLAELLGGSLNLRRDTEVGATFQLTLPPRAPHRPHPDHEDQERGNESAKP